MGGMSVDGLISGLDTTSLIAKLMQAEAGPQTLLRRSVSLNETIISGYQGINSRFASLRTWAEGLNKPEAWTSPKVTSTSTNVTATATSTASSGQIQFDVTAVATAHSVATATFANLSDIATSSPVSLTVTKGGTAYTITPADDSVAAAVTAINAATDGSGASLGLRATSIEVSPGQFRLQVSSKDTGAANQFTLDGLGAMSTVRTGADATIDLGAGLVVKSATNTFSGLISGVSFTVSKVETGVTVSAAVDPGDIADRIQNMVFAANAGLSEIDRLTSYDAATKRAAPLVGDRAVRDIRYSVLDGLTSEVGTSGSPGSAGIALDRAGKLTFDRAKFLELQKSDPARAQALVEGVAQRLATAATAASDKETGKLTLAIQGRMDTVKDLNGRIEAWDLRLAIRKTTLQRQFAAMETGLSTMRNQSNWLAGQLANLARPSSS